MSEKLKTIIVDDEPVALRGIEKYVKEIKFLELVGVCENAIDANVMLNEHSVDLMFLDIEMPKITGLDFLQSLKYKPITIVTSAYPGFAVSSYEQDVIDYLVKPVPFERFLKAVNKAKAYYDLSQIKKELVNEEEFIFIKCDKKIEKVFFDDILYIESLHNYVAVYTTSVKFITYLTLKNLEDTLPKSKFIKVQKSFIVSIDKVSSIDEGDVIIDKRRISISRANKDEIIKTILGNNFLKR